MFSIHTIAYSFEVKGKHVIKLFKLKLFEKVLKCLLMAEGL